MIDTALFIFGILLTSSDSDWPWMPIVNGVGVGLLWILTKRIGILPTNRREN